MFIFFRVSRNLCEDVCIYAVGLPTHCHY